MKRKVPYFFIKHSTIKFIIICILLNLGMPSYAESSENIIEVFMFKINAKTYYSKGIMKTLDTAPIIENGLTMIPFRTIFEELGYSIQWFEETSTMMATNKYNTIQLKLNDKRAIVNGKEKLMDAAPKFKNSIMMVPLNFIAENIDVTVEWREKTQIIIISRMRQFNLGKVMIYEKTNKKNDVLTYDGNIITIFPFENKEIRNWYAYKGKILLTVFDKTHNNNNFIIFKDNKFEILINNFDIKDAFEYNNNLILHGYDRDQKENNLYRFDGNNLILIQKDFYMGKYYIFKDKLIINKYDSERDYLLLAFDKNSWKPGIIEHGFIIQDMREDENYLYMAGVEQSGKKRPLAAYTGKTTDFHSFILLHPNPNTKVNLHDITIYKDKLYFVKGGKLITYEDEQEKEIIFNHTGDVYKRYNISSIVNYNDTLYLAVSGGAYVDKDGKSMKFEGDKIKPGVVNFSLLNLDVILEDFKFSKFIDLKNRLMILGIDNREGKDDNVLYVTTDGSRFSLALDVSAVNDTITLGNNTFIAVKDKDRITNKARDTMLLYNNNQITNLILGMSTRKWSIVNNNFIFQGYEADIKKNKVYTYGRIFKELMDNFEAKYWEVVGDNLFINGTHPDDKLQRLYKFDGKELVELRENIEIINIIKMRSQYYLIYARDKTPKSPTSGKKILYVFDNFNNEFIEMKVDIEVSDMIFIE
ncbi:copper amine oxidase [Clostridium aceticum]|uniref:Copper amine oxidase n=1 Tax=Clostridium aceticum TaxID=84022 RepID=A0A0G3WEJ1_9CLOT|nr:copper amine oxidase N-terminal domain-containing protein [Clostridium aceticum]AKL96347.1 copper amine oxidase [Clostridium aceticum]